MDGPSVEVVVAPNAGAMTGSGTNTYVVGRNPAVVIDPAVDDREYIDRVTQLAGDIGAILVTHRHPDHVAGAPVLAAITGAPVRAWGEAKAGGARVIPLADGEVLRAGDVALTALHTPGHSSDHLCFFTDTGGVLFSGDVILGAGTSVIAPPDGSMAAYMATLERLRGMPIEAIYPAHGPRIDEPAWVIDGYIEHRRARERAIVAAIGTEATLEEIVERAYADTPPDLHAIAAYSARAHLEWLVEKGEIEVADDKWRVRDVNKVREN